MTTPTAPSPRILAEAARKTCRTSIAIWALLQVAGMVGLPQRGSQPLPAAAPLLPPLQPATDERLPRWPSCCRGRKRREGL